MVMKTKNLFSLIVVLTTIVLSACVDDKTTDDSSANPNCPLCKGKGYWEKSEYLGLYTTRFDCVCKKGLLKGDLVEKIREMRQSKGSNPSFRGNGFSAVRKSVSNCSGSSNHCSCKLYVGEKRDGLEQYRGNCSNIVNEHRCNHSPASHGLSEY